MAAPLAVLVSITIAAIVVAQDWQKIHFRSAGLLVGATIPGIPVGLLLLTSRHEAMVKAVLGALIACFACWALLFRRGVVLERDSRGWLLGCGFCAGIMGGAYGMNGPPLVVYGSMRAWPAPQFRATLQAYFLPASLLGMCGYWVAGLWTAGVTHYYLVSLPVMAPAVLLGRAINHRLHGEIFLKLVYVALAAIGVLLVEQAMRGRI